MLGRLPEGRRPGQGDPADQARHHDAVRPALWESRLSAADTEAMGAPPPATRTFRPPIGAGWWLRKGHYFWYVVREFTALPLAVWLLWLLVEIKRAGGG